MKKSVFALCFLVLCCSCKQGDAKTKETLELTIAEQIANAHGFENWDKVKEIQFKFGKNRLWNWNPKTDNVRLTTDTDTIVYNRKFIDSTYLKADRAFINDKFWLLIPFQLVWDASASISKPMQKLAPISKNIMNKITITYPPEGGYTPGDAYDIYFDKDLIIKEWVFRKGNKPEPSLINTFENYQDFKGIKLALDHKKANDKGGVKFTNVKVKF
ncbi:hypothetical protein [Seonamhaeicola aphaedonensis]|uniref:Outer membrane lipoprotein-sorting protein n=1 Tax=Seonamhaeicola aphaedonensis TaxID=1461338 RepID=A0A3D9HFP4_9FLAO|nr:hypothetical protein [Seonamhaeicola aphaedonensis]RED48303.1 hypothetical protein DFQ02_104148 [Seonamhaeicola aphaedonensis]